MNTIYEIEAYEFFYESDHADIAEWNAEGEGTTAEAQKPPASLTKNFSQK